jgi:hypothetical protein
VGTGIYSTEIGRTYGAGTGLPLGRKIFNFNFGLIFIIRGTGFFIRRKLEELAAPVPVCV